jgi:hypothetical protein
MTKAMHLLEVDATQAEITLTIDLVMVGHGRARLERSPPGNQHNPPLAGFHCEKRGNAETLEI